MKIAVIAKTKLPIAEPFRGGLEAFTASICKQYIQDGHDVTLYAHPDSDPSLNVKSLPGKSRHQNDDPEVRENDEYAAIIRDIEHGSYDIVHNNSTHELPILWASQAAVPLVTTLHTPPDLQSVKKMQAAISTASVSKNLHFVTVSKALGKMWLPYTHNGSTVIYNGIDLNRWPLVRTQRDYLLWYGRMVAPKGLDIALDAAHEVGLPLRFAGPLDDTAYYNNEIKPRVQSADRYLGHLQQSAILANMHGAAAMINAARWEEPFGLTNIEAMSAGVPVAGFDRGAFRELIGPGSGVVATETTVMSLAAAIRSAVKLESKTVRRQAEKFSLSTLGQNYLDYFKTIYGDV